MYAALSSYHRTFFGNEVNSMESWCHIWKTYFPGVLVTCPIVLIIGVLTGVAYTRYRRGLVSVMSLRFPMLGPYLNPHIWHEAWRLYDNSAHAETMSIIFTSNLDLILWNSQSFMRFITKRMRMQIVFQQNVDYLFRLYQTIVYANVFLIQWPFSWLLLLFQNISSNHMIVIQMHVFCQVALLEKSLSETMYPR